jgi:acetyl esterase/lipase
VIAVHPRGQGKSINDFDDRLGEHWAQYDTEELASYLEEKNIDPRHTIMAGESMGGALATMLAVEMTARKKPPAVLGMVVSFNRLAEPTANFLRKKGLLPSREDLKDHPDGEGVCEEHDELMHQSLPHRFDTGNRLKELDPRATSVYIANAPADSWVPFTEHRKLVNKAREAGLVVKTKVLEGDYIRPGVSFAHLGWDAAKVTADIQQCYHERSRSIPTSEIEVKDGQGVQI